MDVSLERKPLTNRYHKILFDVFRSLMNVFLYMISPRFTEFLSREGHQTDVHMTDHVIENFYLKTESKAMIAFQTTYSGV